VLVVKPLDVLITQLAAMNPCDDSVLLTLQPHGRREDLSNEDRLFLVAYAAYTSIQKPLRRAALSLRMFVVFT